MVAADAGGGVFAGGFVEGVMGGTSKHQDPNFNEEMDWMNPDEIAGAKLRMYKQLTSIRQNEEPP